MFLPLTDFRSAISHGLGSMSPLMFRRIALGTLLVLFGSYFYYLYGFNWLAFSVWACGIMLGGSAFFDKKYALLERLGRLDFKILAGVLLVSIPIFLWSIYTIPFQLSEDEVALITCEQNWVRDGTIDFFGLSPYFGFPYFPYLLLGWAGQLLGDINLYHQRLLHGIDAVLIVGCAYLFYRVLGLSRFLSLAGTTFVATNHALVAISRMAFKDNGALLMELLSLTFLFGGLIQRSFFTTYIGGVLAGIACYVYYPARITVPIWLIFLLTLAYFQRKKFSVSELTKQSAIFAFGFLLAVTPMVASFPRTPDYVEMGNQYQKTALLIYPEGRSLAKGYAEANTEVEGLIRNAWWGLTLFNNNLSDHGHKYVNEGFGFVDPLSGLLLWIGFVWVLIFMRNELAAILILEGFLIQFFAFSFIVSKTPDYTRLLVILPFAGYFVVYGISAIAHSASSRFSDQARARSALRSVAVCLLAGIVGWNAVIFSRYAIFGAQHGQDNGGTARYLEARKWQPNHLFIVAASPAFPYFDWDLPGAWTDRMRPFLGPKQTVELFSPEDLMTVKVVPPFTVFMNGDLWYLKRQQLLKMYPKLIAHKIADNRGLVAVEEPTNTASSRLLYQSWSDRVNAINGLFSRGKNDAVKTACTQALSSGDAAANGSLCKARILLLLGAAYLNTGDYDKAIPLLKEALDIRIYLAGWYNLDTVDYANSLGDAYMRKGAWALAEDAYRKGLTISTNSAQDDPYNLPPKDLPLEHQKVAGALYRQGRWAEADELLKQIPGGLTAKTKSDMLGDIAFAEREHSRLATAATLFRRAIKLREGTPVDDDLAQLHAELAFTYMSMEDFHRSELEYAEAAKIVSPNNPKKKFYERDGQYAHQLFVANTPKSDNSRAIEDFSNKAFFERDHERLASSCSFFEKAIQLKERSDADDQLAQLYAELGFSRLALKQFTESARAYAKALEISSIDNPSRSFYERDRQFAQGAALEARKQSKVSPAVQALAEKADAERESNHFVNALSLIQQAIQVQERSAVDDNLAQLYAELGFTCLAMKRLQDSEKAYTKAIEISSIDCPSKPFYERDRNFVLHLLHQGSGDKSL